MRASVVTLHVLVPTDCMYRNSSSNSSSGSIVILLALVGWKQEERDGRREETAIKDK